MLESNSEMLLDGAALFFCDGSVPRKTDLKLRARETIGLLLCRGKKTHLQGLV